MTATCAVFFQLYVCRLRKRPSKTSGCSYTDPSGNAAACNCCLFFGVATLMQTWHVVVYLQGPQLCQQGVRSGRGDLRPCSCFVPCLPSEHAHQHQQRDVRQLCGLVCQQHRRCRRVHQCVGLCQSSRWGGGLLCLACMQWLHAHLSSNDFDSFFLCMCPELRHIANALIL